MSGFVLLLTFIKQPLGIGLYLNALALMAGLIRFVSKYNYSKSMVWIFLMLMQGCISNAIAEGNVTSLLRSFQVFLLMFFSLFMMKKINSIRSEFFLIVIALTILVYCFELYLGVRYTRDILGHDIPRLSGLHGEPNYNSILLLSVGILAINYYGKINFICIVLVILSLAGSSRGAIMGAGAFIAVYMFYRWSPRLVYYTAFLLLLMLFIQPLVLYYGMGSVSEEDIIKLNVLSSDRIAHWAAYLNMAMENLSGVGYFNSQRMEYIYIDELLFPNVKPQQAHSMYFSTLADFGVTGYILLFAFFFNLLLKVKASSIGLGVVVFLLTSFSTLNFLGEISFWIMISLLLSIDLKRRVVSA